MKYTKVVLISESGYSEKYDALLISFLDRRYELFCAVGIQCELWEEVMDELSLGNGDNSRYITTSSHPRETEEEVVEFANIFITNTSSAVEVIRI